jgi:hypothetical protein
VKCISTGVGAGNRSGGLARNLVKIKGVRTTGFCGQDKGYCRAYTFEFRAVTSDPKANGETDFKGSTVVLNTKDRVKFLAAYADYAAARFGIPNLDQLAVTAGEAEARLAQIKTEPLPAVRKVLRINEGWNQAASVTPASERHPRLGRSLSGATVV